MGAIILLIPGGVVGKVDGAQSPAASLTTMPLPFFPVCVCAFSGSHLWHMEVPRLVVKSELQLQLSAYTTVTATPDP